MKTTRTLLLLALVIVMSQWAMAQGQGGQRPNPAEMVKREKAMILEKITSLSDDQKLILDQVYTDYENSITKLREESSGNREGMREKMQAIRATKEEALQGLLNEEQNEQYAELKKSRREGRGQGQGQRKRPAN